MLDLYKLSVKCCGNNNKNFWYNLAEPEIETPTQNKEMRLAKFSCAWISKFFCLVLFVTEKFMCEKVINGFKWELQFFCLKIYLDVISFFNYITLKFFNFNAMPKVFQRVDFKNFFCLVFFATCRFMSGGGNCLVIFQKTVNKLSDDVIWELVYCFFHQRLKLTFETQY